MIRVECSNCHAKYRFNESLLKGKSSGQARCKKCGQMIEVSLEATSPLSVEVPDVPKQDKSPQDPTTRVRTIRSDEEAADHTMTMSQGVEDILELPQDKKYSLAVLQGKASGEIFPLTKCRVTIGRADTDILLDDPECSRQHAVLEIRGLRTMLRDMGSTNGTFVDGKRIDETELDRNSEFRIGEHVMMLIITDRE